MICLNLQMISQDIPMRGRMENRVSSLYALSCTNHIINRKVLPEQTAHVYWFIYQLSGFSNTLNH